MAKALELNEKICPWDQTFKASTGWLKNLQSHHERSANKDCLGDFKANLWQHFEEEGLSLSQVHNCNETGLCCKALPTKMLASQKEEKAHGDKIMVA